MTFKEDMSLEEKHASTVKKVLGLTFFEKELEADLHEATDFGIYVAEKIRVAVRLRRHKYFHPPFDNEFTIRFSRPSGVPTEYDKIMAGGADRVTHIFYGFLNESMDKIIAYFIGDLDVFRILGPIPAIRNNVDDSSVFAVYNLDDFPDVFIIKRYRKD